MKLLVCISKTPDTTTRISFRDNNTKFNADKVQYIINPYDEWYALVRAIELKEKGLAQQVTTVVERLQTTILQQGKPNRVIQTPVYEYAD